MVCVGCDFFFFFKQKTAYEMRISDWSSDVCSSDIVGVGVALAAIADDRDLLVLDQVQIGITIVIDAHLSSSFRGRRWRAQAAASDLLCRAKWRRRPCGRRRSARAVPLA